MASLRTQLEVRESLEQLRKEQQEEREREDRTHHAYYMREMTNQGLTPLSFEEWKTFLPEDQEDAATRAAIATANSNWQSVVRMTASSVASQPLSDDVLAELGFDLEDRPRTDVDLNVFMIQLSLETFMREEPRYRKALHWDQLCNFICRNHLNPTTHNLKLAFSLLWNFRLVEPEPEPQTQEEQQSTVNLEVEPDPEIERQRRLREYEEAEVVRYEGRGYSQRELDEMPSELFAKVTRVKRFSGWLPPVRNV